MKRMISILLTITMAFCITSSIQLSASAATTDTAESNSTYTYTDKYGSWGYKWTDSCDGYKITYYDKSMSDIEIPATIDNVPVLEIGDGAFSYYHNLASITIPNSVTAIDDNAFYFCEKLTSIDVSSNNKKYSSTDGVLFDKAQSKLICYPAGKLSDNYTIPDSVTSISNNAFYLCCNLASITIPDSVTSIGDHAFESCHHLASITLSNSITTIGDYAFTGCSSLTSITLPDSVTSIGDHAFFSCRSLTSINVSANNKKYSSIDGVLFDKAQSKLICYPVKKSSDNYTIPDSVTSIDNGAFLSCSSLTSIAIPDSVTSISDYAFDGCSSLNSITIPDSVTSIGFSTFGGCSSLTSITIPDSVTSISDYAFDGCISLKDVYYTGSESQWSKISISSKNDYLQNATIHFNFIKQKISDLNNDDTISLIDILYFIFYKIFNL